MCVLCGIVFSFDNNGVVWIYATGFWRNVKQEEAGSQGRKRVEWEKERRISGEKDPQRILWNHAEWILTRGWSSVPPYEGTQQRGTLWGETHNVRDP